MANRYWVGGDGLWSDSSHWSTTSGGVGGASIPTSVDDVFIDDNSGGSGFVLTIPNTLIEIYFKSFTDIRTIMWEFTKDGQSGLYPTFNNWTGITFSENIIIQTMGQIKNFSDSVLDLKGKGVFYDLRNNASYNLTIVSNAVFSRRLLLISATETLTLQNSAKLKLLYILKDTSTEQVVTLNSGTLELNYLTDTEMSTLNLDAGTSTLRLLDPNRNFESGSLTWHNVDLQGDNITINGSPTINQLKGVSGQTIKIQSGQTIKLSDLDIDGCSLIGLT